MALYDLCGQLGLMANSVALVIDYTILKVPYCYLTVLAVLQGFDVSLALIARSLGTNWRQLWFRIMLPALLHGLGGRRSSAAFITSFDDVVMAMFLTTLRNRTLPKLMYEGITMDFDQQSRPDGNNLGCLVTIAFHPDSTDLATVAGD